MVFIVALGEVLRFPFFYGVSPWRFFFFYVIFPQWMKIIIHFRNFSIVDYMSVVPLLLQCKCGGLSHSNAKYHLHRWEKKIIAKSTYDKIQHYKIINKNKYICLLLRLSAFFVCIFFKENFNLFLALSDIVLFIRSFFRMCCKKKIYLTPHGNSKNTRKILFKLWKWIILLRYYFPFLSILTQYLSFFDVFLFFFLHLSFIGFSTM